MDQPQPQGNQMQIKVEDAVLAGRYSSAMQVQHTKEEFILDFMNLFPPTGTLQARIIVSPAHLKRIVATLADNLQKYEAQFGVVAASEAPNEIGFTTK
jgi:hypothetical protein